VERRAAELLSKTETLLKEISDKGLFGAIESGTFAGVKRTRGGGKGLEGVFPKSSAYYNPVEEQLKRELGL
jgi:beta-lysine 5,6-aminomutase alpha subunit